MRHPRHQHPARHHHESARRRSRSRRGQPGGALAVLVKALAYRSAPRLTFAVLHPRKAVQLRKVPFDLRTAYAPRLAALAAVAIALPFGVLLGRALERRAWEASLAPEPTAGGPPRPRIRPRRTLVGPV